MLETSRGAALARREPIRSSMALVLDSVRPRVPEYVFTTAFSSFCFASLFRRSEVMRSLGEVRQENLKLMASCMYRNKLIYSAITSMAQSGTRWVTRLSTFLKIILTNFRFREVGKGWCSIQEAIQDMCRQDHRSAHLHLRSFGGNEFLYYSVFTRDRKSVV